MHIVAIGWLYVVLMMSISETSVVAGLLTMFFYGLLPVAIILYISGSKQRKKKQAQRERAQKIAGENTASNSRHGVRNE